MEEYDWGGADLPESGSPAYPQMHRAARTTRSCSTHGTYFKHAPKGHLDELIASNPTGARIDQGWDQENLAAYARKLCPVPARKRRAIQSDPATLH